MLHIFVQFKGENILLVVDDDDGVASRAGASPPVSPLLLMKPLFCIILH
jgi:hypothetical protein